LVVTRTTLAEAVERSAEPDEVRRAVDAISGLHPGVASRLEEDAGLREAVVAVAGASRFLARLLALDPEALGILGDLDRRPPLGADDGAGLARWKALELLRVAARDLVGLDSLEVVGANLAQLGDDVLVGACRLGRARQLVVVGMGKLGARELNYASDVDVVFVGEGDPRPLLGVARRCFRVDADLRPEGRNGPLTRTLASFEAYWDRWAATWEFQALLKARPVAGDADLGAAFMAAAAQRVWGRAFGADDLRALRAMKARVESEVARRGLAGREVKRGPGGIRDVEFAVQLLQLVHGGHDQAIRHPATLPALRELALAGYVDPADSAALEDAYRFLRTVEHRLQLVEDQQVHTVPADTQSRTRLARVLGHRDDSRGTALARFDDQLRGHQAAVRSIHQRLFFRPLLEVFSADRQAGQAAPMAPGLGLAAAEARLAAFGFADAERTRQALRELTRGLTRSSRLMQQLLPLLLGWLSESPNPDLGLLGLRTLAAQHHRSARLVATFRESPEAARRLCLLLGTSRLLASGLEHQPDVIPILGDDERLGPATDRAAIVEAARTAVSWRREVEGRRSGLHRLKQAEELRIQIRDVLGLDDVRATGARLTGLAEAVLEAALATLAPPVPMAVVALGRLGGAELSYASDLDLLVVYQGDAPADFEAAEGVAETLLRFVNGATPATRLYRLDADLRPEGKQGPLARSLDGFEVYYRRWARTWERQALVRARPVAGDPELGRRFCVLIEPFVWDAPLTEDQVREIRRMKARIERERIPAGDDPQFHLKLGRGSLSDVEWTAQLLQLRHRVRAPGTIDALDALVAANALDPADADVLGQAYRFCERARNRWYLVKGAPGDSLPAGAEPLAHLARSLGTSAPELRDRYRRVTRRARSVMERLFYGTDV